MVVSSRALETIKAAKLCGVHAVKIQTYTPDTMTIDCDLDDFKIQKGIWKGENPSMTCMVRPLHHMIGTKNYLVTQKKIGVTIFSTPFDETAVDLLETLNTPACKIASFEITDLPLLSYVASKGKPMLISTGMATFEEIGEALETATTGGCKDIAILHCVRQLSQPHYRQQT